MYDDFARPIPPGHVPCPLCDGIGWDISHDGDSWDEHGHYKGIYSYTRCHLCDTAGHVTEAAALAHTTEQEA